MALFVVKDKQLCPVPIRGVFTLPTEDATVKCRCLPDGTVNHACKGIPLTRIPLRARQFQQHVYQLKDQLIERQKARGREFAGKLALHGPFPSYDLNSHLVDIKSSMWTDAMRPDANGDEHPENALGAVFERDMAFSPYSDYVYLADFLGYEYHDRASSEGGLPV